MVELPALRVWFAITGSRGVVDGHTLLEIFLGGRGK